MENITQEYKSDSIEIDLRDLFMVILKRGWIIVLAGLVTAMVAFGYSRFYIAPQYQSTTQIYILNKTENSSITYNDLQTGSQITNDYMTLVKSRPVLEEVISELNLNMDYKSLANKIRLSNPSGTRIITFIVEYSDPVLAKKIVDSVRDASSEHITKIMNIEKVNTIEEGNIPNQRVSPSLSKNTIIGGFLGGFIAIAIILLIYFLDDTIKTPDDIEKHLGLSVLSSIPIQEGMQTSGKNSRKKKMQIRGIGNKGKLR